jgi:hypothetical protein
MENANEPPKRLQVAARRNAKSPVLPLSERSAFSPAEFAALFGREMTWTYRLLYAGRVRAIRHMKPAMIPRSEVERLTTELATYGEILEDRRTAVAT